MSWYYLPFEEIAEKNYLYSKLFICSMEKDRGKSYLYVADNSKKIQTQDEILKLLESKKVDTAQIKKCMNNEKTAQQVAAFEKIMNDQKINRSTQIVYNDEVENQIPGLMDLQERIEMKLRIKQLIK